MNTHHFRKKWLYLSIVILFILPAFFLNVNYTTPTYATSCNNLLVNGDFSNGLNNWTSLGNYSNDNGTLKIGTGYGGAEQIINTPTIATDDSVTLSGMVATNGDPVKLQLAFEDANGNLTYDANHSYNENPIRVWVDTSNSNYQALSVTGTTPAGTTRLKISVWKDGGTDFAWADD